MRKYFCSIVIPIFKSQQPLFEIHKQIKELFLNAGSDYELIFIDDSGKAASWPAMKKLREKDSRVKIICLDANYGQHNALMCGLRHAKGEYVITIDDDLQYLPGEIPKLIGKIEQENLDVVFGVPGYRQHSKFKSLGSKIYNQMFLLTHRNIPRVTISSFRIMRSSIVKEIIKYTTPSPIVATLIARTSRKWGAVTVEHGKGQGGRSSYSLRKYVRNFTNGLTCDRPRNILAIIYAVVFIANIIISSILVCAVWSPQGYAWHRTVLVLWIVFLMGSAVLGWWIFVELSRSLLYLFTKRPQYRIRQMDI